jgi:HEAT repeat protein
MRTLRPAFAGAVFMLAAGVAGCTGYGPPLSVQVHEAFLGHSQSYAAEGLLSPSPLIRRWSIVSLARAGDPKATDAFILMLNTTQEPVALVRATAAVGLRVLGDKRAIPALVTACSDPEPIVRADAVRTLGDLGGPPEIATLAPLARRDPDANVRLEAVYAIQRIGGEETIPIFISALSDPDESVAFAAHSALLSLTGLQLSPDKTQWQKWWQEQHNVTPAKP